MIKTEFFDSAVKLGFYGSESGSLFGKKDYVRKYWEDFSIKDLLKPVIIEILTRKEKIRITDFGCGSGEAYELITHISSIERPSIKDFLLSADEIEFYLGLDISKEMIKQGTEIYKQKKNIRFTEADLSKEYPFLEEKPFDIYMSTYSSPSHLTSDELKNLIEKVLRHSSGKTYLVLDLFGKYSPEWPCYWADSKEELLPYNMLWLQLPAKLENDNVESYFVKYWDGKSITCLINQTAEKQGKNVKIKIKDRSLFTGRHIDTGFFNHHPLPLRYQVNRLFDREYEGKINELFTDFTFLENYTTEFPEVWERLNSYQTSWNIAVSLCGALIDNNNAMIKELIETTEEVLAEELKMLTWLFRNQQRFPVDNFWASIMGPQLACVLRNLELNLPDGLGCGHGLFCIVEIE